MFVCVWCVVLAKIKSAKIGQKGREGRGSLGKNDKGTQIESFFCQKRNSIWATCLIKV